MRWKRGSGVAVLTFLGVAGACNVGKNGEGNVAPDAATDAADEMAVDAADAGGDAPDARPIDCTPQFRCGDRCVETCAGCDAGKGQCNATRECGDCTTCPSSPFPCFACNSGSPLGLCVPGPNSCANKAIVPCSCDAGVGSCPGGNQVCIGEACESCGEIGSDGLRCENGMKCSAATYACTP